VGIIGMGLMGQRRAKHLAPDELVAVYDPAGESYGDLDSCELLVVATSTPALVEAALPFKGKRILLEKPCGMNATDLERLKGYDITPGYTLRHYPGVRALSDVLRNHGEHYSTRIVYGHGGGATGWRKDTGELLDQGSHCIDLVHYLYGPVTVGGAHTFHDDDGADWGAALTLSALDASIHISTSYREWQPTLRVEVFTSDGQATLTGLGGAYGPHRLEVRDRYKRLVLIDYGDATDRALDEEWRSFRTGNTQGGYYQALETLKRIDDARGLLVPEV
jgi:predicted dehydrogenase